MGLVIADVEGSGMGAALLVSAIRASLISLAGLELALRAIFRRANRFFYLSAKNARYVTVFYAVLDVPQRRLIYVNAGHLPAILVRSDGSVERLEEGGFRSGSSKILVTTGVRPPETGDALSLCGRHHRAVDASEEPWARALCRTLRDARVARRRRSAMPWWTTSVALPAIGWSTTRPSL
jgi:hypothetical protein